MTYTPDLEAIKKNFVLVRSDRGDGGWSIHVPGATDADIAEGHYPPLVSGDSRDGPTDADYLAAEQAMFDKTRKFWAGL